jgi:hypothetical protein
MIYEASGLGTGRYDACTSLGPPSALVTLRTRRADVVDVRNFATNLLREMAGIWETTPVLKMQVHAGCAAEGCYVVVTPTGDLDRAQFSARALDVYRAVLSRFRTTEAQPPISHDTIFLPDGKVVRYEGKN